MPVHYSNLAKLNFDQDAYSKVLPLGVWKAKVEQAAYTRGAKTYAWLLGRRVQVHLYVHHESGWKFLLPVPLLPGLASFSVAAELHAGDIIEVEIASSKTGLPVVKRLRKVDEEIQLPGK